MQHERICDGFEQAWKRLPGMPYLRPDIAEYLGRVPDEERRLLFHDLLSLELELRRRDGENPGPEEYYQRFPHYVDAIDGAFGSSATAPSSKSPQAGSSAHGVDTSDGAGRGDLKPPARLGRYTITDQLGSGGFGVVYKGYDAELRREVAIKVPHRRRLARPEDAATYLAEARIVAGLDHPHIVPVYDLGRSDDGLCFVVSKFIRGSDLGKRIRAGRPPLADTVEWIIQVAEALHHAHIQGLVHRDIKPSNILLDAAGKAYVADFGLAMKEEDFGKGEGWCGTPAYMSPEQARGEGHRVDGRSDIFSLGIVLYELLTGRRPFRGDATEIARQIITDEPRPPRQVDDHIPAELERFCLKAMAKKTSERYTTARDLADDLRSLLAGQAGVVSSASHGVASHSLSPALSVSRGSFGTTSRVPVSAHQSSGLGTGGQTSVLVPDVHTPPPARAATRGFTEKPDDSSATEVPQVHAAPAAPPARIALLYKRDARPDEELLHWLEKEFGACGHHVFVDRHMTIGMEWAKEIERQLRSMDAVVVLLSAASVQSEMLALEVQIVQDEAQKRDGKPMLLPVRVNFEGRLPAELAPHLDRLQYSLWHGHQDNSRLLAELQNALLRPPPLAKLPPPGGVIPLDTKFYVERPTDRAFHHALSRRDSVILIRGARQMGKTSLLARGLHQARAAGTRVIVTDFQKLNASNLASIEKLYRTLGRWIAHGLEAPVKLEEVWDPDLGASVNFENFVMEVLKKTSGPVVWAMDEADRLFPEEYGSEVFGLFRSWHNARDLDPDQLLPRLTLVISYATEAHLFIRDINQSPFNVGTQLALEDFTAAQVNELNKLYGSPLKSDRDLARFFQLLGGQPYLVNRGLYEMVQQGLDTDAFLKQADRDEGIFGDHLRRILVMLARNEKLAEVVRGVLHGKPCPDADSFHRLRSAGVMAGDSVRAARLRCQLYGQYLERHLS